MFEFELGIFGAGALVVLALAVAIAFQFVGEPFGWGELGATFVAAIVGGFVASEWLALGSGFGPTWDGLYLLPAVVGGVLVGTITAFGYRLVAGRGEAGHVRA